MPFVSKAQQKFMWMKHPGIAKEFQAATPKNAKLPEHVKKAGKARIPKATKSRIKLTLKKA